VNEPGELLPRKGKINKKPETIAKFGFLSNKKSSISWSSYFAPEETKLVSIASSHSIKAGANRKIDIIPKNPKNKDGFLFTASPNKLLAETC